MGVERFIEAQANTRSGYGTARAELLAGAKQTHWIWWVFPQLAGLGSSSVSVRYAIEDRAEALHYLRDPVLGGRLHEAVGIVRRQLEVGISLRALMGSPIDCSKLVSSLTLFATVGQTEESAAGLVAEAEAVLALAAAQGFPRCGFSGR